MFKLNLEKHKNQRLNCQYPLDLRKSKSWLCKNFWLCGSQQTVENYSRDGNTRPPYLPPEKNLYAGQEATVRTVHGTTDWSQIGKGECQSCILSPCLFNLYAEYIMWNVRLDEAQAGVKIVGRNINNLRYADDTTLMEESEEELKSLLMKVKEESEKDGLKLNIQKTKIMASNPITSWHIDGETMENSYRDGNTTWHASWEICMRSRSNS